MSPNSIIACVQTGFGKGSDYISFGNMTQNSSFKITQFTPELIDEISITGVPAPALMGIHSVAVDPEGMIYCSDEFNHRVIKLDQTGRFVSVIGARGSGDGQFWYPRGLTVAQNDESLELVVCDSWNHRAQRLGLDGAFIMAFGSIGDGAGHFNEPVSVIQGQEGALWILDRCNHRVKEHSFDGRLISMFGSRSSRSDEESVNDPENVYFGGSASLAHGYFFPEAFVMPTDGTYVIADTGNRRLCMVDGDGSVRGTINLDIEKSFPYRYPRILVSIDKHHLLTGCLGMPFEIIDTVRPWLTGEIDLNCDPERPPAVQVIKQGEGAVELLVVDGWRGVIKRFMISSEPDRNQHISPGAFPKQDDLQLIPNRWTEQESEYWKTYLINSIESEQAAELAGKYLNTCQASATSAAKALMETEAQLCKAFASCYEVGEEVRKIHPMKDRSSGLQSKFQEEQIKRISIQKECAAYRRALIGDIARSTEILRSEGLGKLLADERAAFIRLMKSEYGERRANYEEVAQWLHGHLQKPDALNMAASVHALAAILLLKDHLSYIVKAVSRLDKSFTPAPLIHESEMNSALAKYKEDSDRVWSNPMHFLTELCEAWDYQETLQNIFQKGYERNDESKDWYAGKLFDSLLKSGDKQNAAALLAPLRKNIKTANETIVYVERLHRAGAYAEAAEFIEKYPLMESGDASVSIRWEGRRRMQNLMTNIKPAEVTLSAGQTVGEALSEAGAAAPKTGGALRYLKSICFTHPDTGEEIAPEFIRVVSESELIFSNYDGELFFYEDGEECVKIWGEPGLITLGLDTTSADQAVFMVYEQRQQPPSKYIGIRRIKFRTGECVDFTNEIICDLPEFPAYIVRMEKGGFLISNLNGNESAPLLWLVDGDFKRSEPIHVPVTGYISDICVLGDEAVITSQFSHLIHKIDLGARSGGAIDKKYSVSPRGAAMNVNRLLYVAAGEGLGIQAFDPDGELLFQVTSLVEGANRYDLTEPIHIFSKSVEFSNGDLLLADNINKRAHVFRTA